MVDAVWAFAFIFVLLRRCVICGPYYVCEYSFIIMHSIRKSLKERVFGKIVFQRINYPWRYFAVVPYLPT